MATDTTLDGLCINTIRTLAMDGVQKANTIRAPQARPWRWHLLCIPSGTGSYAFNPGNPRWLNRDRFILWCGHASILLYSTLHVNGFDLPLDDIMNFRQLHSKCPGHPEYTPDHSLTPGVETTTGPLGQGVATSVGMAMANRWLGAHYNRPEHEIISHNIVALCGDGCMMEGISGEAASLAGHLGLSNLVWVYDNNRITIEGNTALAFTDDVATRFMGYHWNVQRVGDANDIEQLEQAFTTALKEDERPSLIIVIAILPMAHRTNRTPPQRTASRSAKRKSVPRRCAMAGTQTSIFMCRRKSKRAWQRSRAWTQQEAAWNGQFAAYKRAYPALAQNWS